LKTLVSHRPFTPATGLLAFLAIAAPLMAGLACYDIVQRTEMIPDCTQGAACWTGCVPSYDDIQPGTTWQTVYSNATPKKIHCNPGIVHVDQFGQCICFPDINQWVQRTVGKINGGQKCE